MYCWLTFSLKEFDMVSLLWAIVVILVICWILGQFVWLVASPLLHLLLVIAVIIVIYNLLTGRSI